MKLKYKKLHTVILVDKMKIKKIKLAMLKRKAKILYGKIDSDLDCGENLKNYIISDRVRLIKEFNETWDKIRLLDPTAPALKIN